MITANIENFTGNELKCRCGCGRLNYDNEFLIRIQAFRYMLKRPMTVTSGGRCVKHNKTVGGEPTSCHECETKKATAIDFICNDLQQAYFLACDCGLFNEVIYYSKKGFIHLALDRKQKDNYFLIK